MMKITMLETFFVCILFCIFSLTWLFVGCFAWASLKMIQVKLVKTMMMMIMMDRWASITWCVVNRKASSLHQYQQKIYNDFFATYFVLWEMATFIRPFLSSVFSHDAESRHWCLLALNDFSDVKSHLIRPKSKVRLAVIVVVILHSNH